MSDNYPGTLTRKRLLKHALSPLIWLLMPLFCVACFVALLLAVLRLNAIADYPTKPFVAFTQWWSGLSES